jgi:3-hexulose-6-phosphate synthase
LGKLLDRAHVTQKPLLQVALDFVRLEDMLRISAMLIDLPINIFEVGTPLIKSEGIRAVSLLRAFLNSHALVLADMKTADVGSLETEVVGNAGGDISTVLASSDDEVIRSALAKGREVGLDVVVDTVGLKNVEERVKQVIGLGARLVNLHVGIDVQKARGLNAADLAEKYRGLVERYRNEVIFSISGGIKPEDIPRLVKEGFRIIVVGSSITKAPDPRKVACKILGYLGKMC